MFEPTHSLNFEITKPANAFETITMFAPKTQLANKAIVEQPQSQAFFSFATMTQIRQLLLLRCGTDD